MADTFGTIVQQLREKERLSIGILAKRVGVSPRALMVIENGGRLPDNAIVDALVAELHVDPLVLYRPLAEERLQPKRRTMTNRRFDEELQSREMPPPDKTLGWEIRRLRNARRWRVGTLARRAGISRTHLARIESGESLPSTMTLGAICSAFGSGTDYLLAIAGEMRLERAVR